LYISQELINKDKKKGNKEIYGAYVNRTTESEKKEEETGRERQNNLFYQEIGLGRLRVDVVGPDKAEDDKQQGEEDHLRLVWQPQPPVLLVPGHLELALEAGQLGPQRGGLLLQLLHIKRLARDVSQKRGSKKKKNKNIRECPCRSVMGDWCAGKCGGAVVGAWGQPVEAATARSTRRQTAQPMIMTKRRLN